MKFNDLVFDFIKKKNLLRITPILNGESKNVLTLSNPESVYNCLKLLEGDNPEADYILIDNPDDKSHLVLMNHSTPVLCIGFDTSEDYEAIIPVSVNRSKGINQQMFSYRYILFLKMELPEENQEVNVLPQISEDQKTLNRFLKSINGEEPMNDELYNWWLNRY